MRLDNLWDRIQFIWNQWIWQVIIMLSAMNFFWTLQPRVEIWDWNYRKIYLNNSFDGLNLSLLLSSCQTWLLWISNNLKQFVVVHWVVIQLWQIENTHSNIKFVNTDFLLMVEMGLISEKQEINKTCGRKTQTDHWKWKQIWRKMVFSRL